MSAPASTRSRSCKLGKATASKGEVLADGAATHNGELALGRNVLVAFMRVGRLQLRRRDHQQRRAWCKEDVYTSIHIEEFDIEIRETKLGREEFTRDIPNVGEKALRQPRRSTAIVRIGTRVRPGDILVGKVSPKSKTELTPEEKLLHAIFGRAGEDVKNDSLEVPVRRRRHRHHTRTSSRRMSLTRTSARPFKKQVKDMPKRGQRGSLSAFGSRTG